MLSVALRNRVSDSTPASNAMIRLCPNHFSTLAILAIALVVTGCAKKTPDSSDARVAAPTRIDFNRHIRPIFNQNCTACHGGVKMAGGISFIYREEATRAGESGRPTIVPGKPEQSELIARVTSTDDEFRMPKPEHGHRLSDHEIALLRQ